ncbi:MAG: L,D-transpeptidase [Hyphomicrobium sp.]|jgi:lipoprotein-anchoring transpeptidase ErfK/SrfK
MRRALIAIAIAIVTVFTPFCAGASVVVRVSKSSQTMHVYVDGELQHVWPVSTGRGGYATPGGSFRPQRLERRWYSTKYRGAPMHNAVFFHGGYAIHGTNEVARLGQTASHGCIRLAPGNAATLYALIRKQGASRTRIQISH